MYFLLCTYIICRLKVLFVLSSWGNWNDNPLATSTCQLLQTCTHLRWIISASPSAYLAVCQRGFGPCSLSFAHTYHCGSLSSSTSILWFGYRFCVLLLGSDFQFVITLLILYLFVDLLHTHVCRLPLVPPVLIVPDSLLESSALSLNCGRARLWSMGVHE